MKKYKTNEEFVLDELYKTQEQLELANKKIDELEEQLEKPVNEEDMKCIYLSDKPNYFYMVNVSSAYNWNKILKDNKKTPKFVEQALEDEKKLKKLFDLKENGNGSYWSSIISKVDERIYNYLFKDRRGNYATITLWGDDDISLYQIRHQNFLDKESAEEYRKEKVINTAKEYLKNYAENFDKEKK